MSTWLNVFKCPSQKLLINAIKDTRERQSHGVVKRYTENNHLMSKKYLNYTGGGENDRNAYEIWGVLNDEW